MVRVVCLVGGWFVMWWCVIFSCLGVGWCGLGVVFFV